MRMRDLAYETFSALDANRVRSLLTVLGIVIGIGAVIAMTALIGGVKQSLVSQLGLTQAQLVYISCYGSEQMDLDDLEDMRAGLAQDYELITPMIYGGEQVSAGDEKKDAQIQGVFPDYERALGLHLAQGRFFTPEEEESGALVAVLDQGSVKNLFGNPDAEVVGKTLRIGSAQYAIVGVAESASSLSAGDDYVSLFVPYSTCAKRINTYSKVDQVYGLAYEGLDMESVAADTKSWLASHFNIPADEEEDSIYVTTMDSVIRQLDTMMMSFQVLMTAVASISLVVGGIGIMNMMLTNVTERIREIGLRKALGARRRDITRQFLLESVCLTLAGGIIGILVGYLGSFGLVSVAGDAIASNLGGDGATLTPYIDMQAMLFATGVCVAIGIVFGYYPARRASRLDPVEALRYQ